MKRFLVLFVLLSGVFLISAKEPENVTFPGVVTHLEIYANHGSETRHYTLSQDQDMRSVLNYFRALDKHIPAENVPAPDPNFNLCVWVYLTSGKRHLYQQIGTDFFRKDAKQWKQLDPTEAEELIALENTLANKVFP